MLARRRRGRRHRGVGRAARGGGGEVAGQPDPKGPRRVRDDTATRRALLLHRACIACGGEASNGHHGIPVGRGQSGDDVVANVLPLCGTGTVGCHGAWHGSPYVHRGERRDAEWVARRIGEALDRRERPDFVAYVLAKLGEEAGREYLWRRYRFPPSGPPATIPADG